MLKVWLLVVGLLVKGQFARQASTLDTSKPYWPTSPNLLQPITNACVDQDIIDNLISKPSRLLNVVKDYLDKAGGAGKQFIDDLLEYNQKNMIKYLAETRFNRPLQTTPLNYLWPKMSDDEITRKILNSFEKHHYPNHFREKLDSKSVLPAGALVRITANNKVRNIRISVNPMMSVMDAIRQAELKLKLKIGEDLHNNLISISHHSTFDCFIIKSIGSMTMSDTRFWNVAVINSSGNTVYSGVCLPSDTELIIKPGTIIEINYEI